MGDSFSAPGAAPACCPSCRQEVRLDEHAPPHEDFLCPHCRYRLWFLCQWRGPVLVLTFLPVTQSNAQTIMRAREVVEMAEDAALLVLDLSLMPLVHSVMLGVLVGVRRQLQDSKTALRVCGLSPMARETFQAAQIHKLFHVFDDQQSALAGEL